MSTSVSNAATRRYVDPPLVLDKEYATAPANAPSLDESVKVQMKQLVLDALNEAMDDDLLWDDLVGRLVTNPMRYWEPLEWEPLDNVAAERCVDDVVQGRGALQRAPGVSLATSRVELTGGGYVDRMFAAGQSWEIANDEGALGIFSRIRSGQTIGDEALSIASDRLKELLVSMLVEGNVIYLAEPDI